MINFTIKDEVGNIIYNRTDDKNQLTDEEIEQIYDALSNLETNMVKFSLSKEQTNDNSYTSYQNLRRLGKSEMLRQCKALCEEYNRQVAALPACHPAEYAASCMREVGSHDENDSHDENNNHDENDSHDDYDNCNSHDDYDGHIPALFGMGLPDHKFEEELRKDILATLPGSYVGCGKHESCRNEDGRGKNGRKGNKRCNLEDFVAYLRTYNSWAALLDDLQFFSESSSEEKTEKLIQKYREWRDEQIRK